MCPILHHQLLEMNLSSIQPCEFCLTLSRQANSGKRSALEQTHQALRRLLKSTPNNQNQRYQPAAYRPHPCSRCPSRVRLDAVLCVGPTLLPSLPRKFDPIPRTFGRGSASVCLVDCSHPSSDKECYRVNFVSELVLINTRLQRANLVVESASLCRFVVECTRKKPPTEWASVQQGCGSYAHSAGAPFAAFTPSFRLNLTLTHSHLLHARNLYYERLSSSTRIEIIVRSGSPCSSASFSVREKPFQALRPMRRFLSCLPYKK